MTLLITVLGIVQGVGYRPFTARLAERLGNGFRVMRIIGDVGCDQHDQLTAVAALGLCAEQRTNQR